MVNRIYKENIFDKHRAPKNTTLVRKEISIISMVLRKKDLKLNINRSHEEKEQCFTFRKSS